ncbi:MAG: GRP family sugar transporter [Candidatus Nanoarchaeia archaeon]|jgi:transporter family protein
MWQLIVILSSVLAGCFNLLNKRLTNINSLKATFYTSLISALILLFFSSNFILPTNNLGWLFLLISALLWGIFRVLYLLVYKHLDISLTSSLIELRIALVLVLSFLLLGNSITVKELIGFAFMFLGALISGYHQKKNYKTSKTGFILLGLLIIVSGFIKIVDSVGVKFFNTYTYSFGMYLIPTIMVYSFMKKKKVNAKITRQNLNIILLLSIIGVASYILNLYAYTLTEVSNVAILSKLSIAVSIIGGFIFYGEKEKLKKIITAILVIIGAIIISV